MLAQFEVSVSSGEEGMRSETVYVLYRYVVRIRSRSLDHDVISQTYGLLCFSVVFGEVEGIQTRTCRRRIRESQRR